jgi:membrane-bound ClpP family serine protease
MGFFAVVLGVAAMVFGFIQLKSGGFARLILNMLFVLGAFLILAGMDGLIGSLSVDLFSIVLIAFWIFTRILLSQWDHWKICRRCSISCKIRGKEEWNQYLLRSP